MYDNIQFDSIRFASAGNEMLVIANCVLNKLNPFSLTLLLTDEAKWHIKKINAKQNIYEIISRNEYRQALENKVAKFLLPTNGWRGEIASETANNMSFNQQLVPPEEAKNLVFSFRYGMLDLPATNWVDLWALIKDRVEGDPFFFIQGFLKDEIRLAINQLILLFPGKWVLARYRNACRLKSPSMANHLPQDSDDWFPAYHLARTALGAICVDPGYANIP